MDFNKYGNSSTEEDAQAGGGNGYDMSAIATTESEMKVPPQLSFVDPAPLTRSLMVHGPESHFGQEVDVPANNASDWGYSAPNTFQPTKSSSSDTFNGDLAPSKLSSADGFNTSKSGSTLGFGTQTLFVESVQARALEPEPIYYEKYSSFTSTSTPQALLEDVSKVFTARSNVDHEPCLDKNKIKGVAYENNGRCTFKVRLYQGSVAGSLLCEFQRRSGCVVSFNKFYRRTIADIASHVSKKVGSGNWINSFDSIDSIANAEPSVQLDNATAVNLISMAGCDNIDVQREGAQALANVAKFPMNQIKLAEMEAEESRIIPLLQKLLGSVDTELCRSGCVLLSCMASQNSLKSALAQSCLDKMVNILNAAPSFETTDSKRQVALALSLLSSTCAPEIVALPSGSMCIEVLKKHMHDASFKQSVLSALSNLHNAAQ